MCHLEITEAVKFLRETVRTNHNAVSLHPLRLLFPPTLVRSFVSTLQERIPVQWGRASKSSFFTSPKEQMGSTFANKTGDTAWKQKEELDAGVSFLGMTTLGE